MYHPLWQSVNGTEVDESIYRKARWNGQGITKRYTYQGVEEDDGHHKLQHDHENKMKRRACRLRHVLQATVQLAEETEEILQ